jgi:hypothetical protein
MRDKGRLSFTQEERQDVVEHPLFALGGLLLRMEEVSLRIRQAQQRTGLVVDVLAPAELRLAEMRSVALRIQDMLANDWQAGMERKWK